MNVGQQTCLFKSIFMKKLKANVVNSMSRKVNKVTDITTIFEEMLLSEISLFIDAEGTLVFLYGSFGLYLLFMEMFSSNLWSHFPITYGDVFHIN